MLDVNIRTASIAGSSIPSLGRLPLCCLRIVWLLRGDEDERVLAPAP
jgi:hypothetical protein